MSDKKTDLVRIRKSIDRLKKDVEILELAYDDMVAESDNSEDNPEIVDAPEHTVSKVVDISYWKSRRDVCTNRR